MALKCVSLIVILISSMVLVSAPLPAVYATNPPTLDGLIDAEYGAPVYSIPVFGDLFIFSGTTHYYFVFNMSSDRNDNIVQGNPHLNDFGWNNHNFKHLKQSDHLGVRIYDCDGTLVYDFLIDYLIDACTDDSCTLSPNDPSRWSSGVFGPDGLVTVGDPNSIETYTSLEYSVENTKYNAPNQEFDFTNGDPAGSPNYANWLSPHYASSPPPSGAWEVNFPGSDSGIDWIFPMRYEWRVPKSAFSPTCLTVIVITEIHNSPDKAGEGTLTTEYSLTTSIDGTTETTTTETTETTTTSETTQTTTSTTSETSETTTTSETTETTTTETSFSLTTETTTTETTTTSQTTETTTTSETSQTTTTSETSFSLTTETTQTTATDPVGGELYSVDKAALMQPYVSLLGLLGAVAAAVAITRGRRP